MIAGVLKRVYFMVCTPIGKPADLEGSHHRGHEHRQWKSPNFTDAENPGEIVGMASSRSPRRPNEVLPSSTYRPTASPNRTPNGYELPQVKADGISPTALDTVTPKGADSAWLQSTIRPERRCTSGVGDSRTANFAAEGGSGGRTSRRRKSLKSDAVSGASAYTVFDSRVRTAAERPRLPRIRERLVLHARPDKQRYSPSDKVQL